MITLENQLLDISEIEKLALNFSKNLKVGDIIMMKGELGSGKTTFARFLINNDRGINVREKSQYLKLLRVHFRKLKSKVTHQPFPPYTWFTTICMK